MSRIPSPRGVFFEQSHALAAVGRLRRDGYDAALARERYAGEDDDADHPWVVTTDAPAIVLELLVEEYDGWLDVTEPPSTLPRATPPEVPAPPVDLPAGPRRVRRPPAAG